MGKRRNDESGKKPPKPKTAHTRRGGQIKEDLAAMRDRLDVMNARLGSLCSAEQDLKLARQECAEGARLLAEMTKERDRLAEAHIVSIPSDAAVVFMCSDQSSTPVALRNHFISKAFERLGRGPLVVYVPKDFKAEALTDHQLRRLGLCRAGESEPTTKDRERLADEVEGFRERIEKSEARIKQVEALSREQEERIKALDPASSVRYAVTGGVVACRPADPGTREPKAAEDAGVTGAPRETKDEMVRRHMSESPFGPGPGGAQ